MQTALKHTLSLNRPVNALRTLKPANSTRCLPVITSSLFSSAKKPAAKTASKGKAVAKQKASVRPKATQFKTTIGKETKATITLGFTKSNELFVGRVAMLGVAASVLGEILTGKGALAQLGLETHLSLTDLGGFIIAGIAFNIIAALAPTKGTFVPDEEELVERPAGPLQDSSITLLDPKRFFGTKGFGFTKANEILVGRLAQLGFAASLAGEFLTGKGPLAQFGLETGIPLNETEPLLLISIIFTLLAAINEGSGKFVDED